MHLWTATCIMQRIIPATSGPKEYHVLLGGSKEPSAIAEIPIETGCVVLFDEQSYIGDHDHT